ncbi:BTAD domain-containing putative transcriptional regulator [Pseudonocardia lacus]|uniref:BTAD domain-containing putative transcriptional regulator n=1 Tax=Pseudonocardia lacus TaxID=2835865 RepID=UPI001BDC0C2F|nr:BTAD domain-containing putative transcriptional regulator [Pseudonocardia lacus]
MPLPDTAARPHPAADPLSETVSLVRARCIASGELVAGGEWSARPLVGGRLGVGVVVRGQCWLDPGTGEPPRLLPEGAVVVARGSRALTVSDRPDRPPVAAVGDGGPGEGSFALLTAVFEVDRAEMLLAALPPLTVVAGGRGRAAVVGALVVAVERELAERAVGASGAVAHYAQLLLLEALRACLSRPDALPVGWLRVLADPRLAPAVGQMLAEPAHGWTPGELARIALVSRSVFMQRFRALAGTTPSACLGRIRMLRAEAALRTSDVPVARLALETGYRSDSAFSAAFKRTTGRSPRAYRAASRAEPAEYDRDEPVQGRASGHPGPVPLRPIDPRSGVGVAAPGRPARAVHPLRLQVLGPLRIWRDGVELDPAPQRQAQVLALLLARAGRPISTSELLDLIWPDAVPPTALNVLHKHVGALRRLLEPALPARGTGSYLLRRGPGYMFAAGPETLDLVDFRELVEAARACAAVDDQDAALESYVEALDLWRGPAADGSARGPAAASVLATLDDEFFDACLTAAHVAVRRGEPGRVLRPLRLAASMAPLNEPVQAALITALGAAGQQAEALSVFRAVRARLVEELGVDPGAVLRAAQQRVLTQSSVPLVTGAADDGSAGARGALVGRSDELTALRHAVDSALGPTPDRGAGPVVVEGEPGAGKTRLLEEIAHEAARRGALVVWGRCLDGDGTPSMWPWVQATGTILDALPEEARAARLAGELRRLAGPGSGGPAPSAPPHEGTRFRLFEQVAAVLDEVAAVRPVVLLVDDLQWADVASLRLFSHLATRLPGRTVLVGAVRDRAPTPDAELTRTLAAASRAPGHRRIRLGPLTPVEVAGLVQRTTGQDPDPAAVRHIHARTAGNPFFVRELSRFLADGGALTEDAVARAGVPASVRDVVRDRMAGLDDRARDLLEVAAILGRDVDLRLLAAAADLDVQTCLDRFEPVEALGLLALDPADPYRVRFTHDLVREAVVDTTPPRRAPRLHLRVADALDRAAPDVGSVAERLAHHLWTAGPLADPARTADALIRAARGAGARSALEAAERRLRSAARLARAAGRAELELSALSQLIAVVGMRSGYHGAALDVLERAEDLARGLGRERDATEFLFSRRAAHSQAVRLDRSGPLARRLLEQGEASADPVVRAYGLYSWGIHQWDLGDIGAAHRYLSRLDRAALDDLAGREDQPLRYDLRLMAAGMLAETTALHGDVDAARALLDGLEVAVGAEPYAVTVWAGFTARIAAMVGDPAWALRGAERGIAQDPGFSFTFFGAYLRLARYWARATTGTDPAGAAAAADAVITATLLDPPRSNVPTWYALLSEMWSAAGELDEAATALDRAERFLDAHGQRHGEGLILLQRARLRHARGEPVAVVRAAAERARALSVDRGAHLFAGRAERFLAELHDPA